MTTKAIFLITQFDQTVQLTGFEIIKVFFYGLRMDLSATGYILLIPGIILTSSILIKKEWLNTIFKTYTIIIGLFLSIITTVDFELFKHWGFRFDMTPLRYLGKDTLSSSTLSTNLYLATLFAIIFTTLLYGYKKIVAPQLNQFKRGKWWHAIIYFAVTATLILPIRGSLDVGPMNVGAVFFHNKKPYANQAAINLFWNFGDSVTKYFENNSYPENFYDKDQTHVIFNNLYQTDTDQHQTIIKKKPNVLLIILESFTAKVIEPLGGLKDVTPNINQLSKEGVLFNNIYASGDRTDKGLISVLSGYPAQPKTSIVTYSSKAKKLPKLSHVFLDMGYKTSFIYGGDPNFANLNSYLNMCMFDKIMTKNDFPDEAITTKWGVHDGIVFDTLYNHLSELDTPFFTTMLTLSSHEPFDVPLKSKFHGNSQEELFINSAFYTDMQIGKFISRFKETDLWNNTLVVFVADHGARHPGKSSNYAKEKFHIPLFWLGGALQVTDTTVTIFGSQTDIATTLLGQFATKTEMFKYGKDLLNPASQSFAFYDYNNGFGYLTDSTSIIYDLNGNKILTNEIDSTELNTGKAYLQTIYSDFNNK